jgi:hypothetical protein
MVIEEGADLVSAPSPLWSYQCFGLSIQSEFPLPGLPTSPVRPADHDLFLRRAPDGGETLRFVIRGVLSFDLSDGQALIAIKPGASELAVSSMISGPVMAKLLESRGLLALHASGWASPERGAVLLAGPSGAGKSTLMMAILDEADEVVGDDLIPIDTSSGRVVACPSYPETRLWPDAAARVAVDHKGEPLAPGVTKARFPLSHRIAKVPHPVAHLVVLSLDDEVELSRCRGVDAVTAIYSCTWERQLLTGDRSASRRHFEQATKLAEQAAIWRLSRPRGMTSIDRVVDALQEAFAEPSQ